ncbi:hypothetical protein BD780_003493 [Clostridium tetanomorphum]|uniref:hypothetical protein n=1 Tax=Clostridium tetanomorphum TaxID=1553 RepID=UPI000448245A|nr:hypothetical protein [Clostridium tetanomorphum]KAJ49380.1 hypothetical protein CTM_23469 [Clostridium tetanomorphum DSM 665]KAJ51219.1 hypothetical protein CTM_13903 [Clostridium tetanomorphum DSM 665]MBP1863692.1 hypothetical protein [Clostridium tetanomorphum]NRS86268.1 hypothetical protein [Clostridium tetanomorphum]SQC00724.1 Uncharacterised protein [Clostridium tetanomorphum]
MGYQESLVYINDRNKFEDLVELIRKERAEWINSKGIQAYGIITLKQDISGDLSEICMPHIDFHFKKGKKFIVIGGERYAQRSIDRIFGDNYLKGTYCTFIECFLSTGLLQDRGRTMSKWEDFDYGLDKEYYVIYDYYTKEVVEIVKGSCKDAKEVEDRLKDNYKLLVSIDKLASITEIKEWIERCDLKINYTDKKHKLIFDEVN